MASSLDCMASRASSCALSAHAAMRARLVALGYPEHAVPNVGITAESQETVDRDFQGNWWHAVK